MGVDKSLIDPQERLVSAGADPGGLSSVFGTDVGHGRRLGVPVGHVQDGPAQLSFLENKETYIHSVCGQLYKNSTAIITRHVKK